MQGGLGLADPKEGREPRSQVQIGRLHDRATREGGTMASAAAPITLEKQTVDEAMLVTNAAWTLKQVRPVNLLQSLLTLLLVP